MSTLDFQRLSERPLTIRDSRGHLSVLFESDGVVLKGSQTRAGVFRGLHHQDESAPQMKIIRVVSGEIIDIVVDLKTRHARYMTVTPDTGWVMVGFGLAHGFYATRDTEFEYFCVGQYRPEAESSHSIVEFLRDVIGVTRVEMSEKDTNAPRLEITSWENWD